MKGSGALALKASATRRRTRAEIREAKLEEAVRVADVEKKLKELEQLKQAHDYNQDQFHNATKIMHQLYEQGLLKQGDHPGQVVMVASYEEHLHLKEQQELQKLEAQSQQTVQRSQVQNDGEQLLSNAGPH